MNRTRCFPNAVVEDPALKEVREKEALERVSRLTDEEVQAQFGCCPTEPGMARVILAEQYYRDLVDEGWKP